MYGEPAGGVSLFAYLLDSLRADTLDPAVERPDYAVQSSDDGAFHFYNVAPGSYRVFAVRDRNNDFRYNAEVEDIGIPDRDIMVEDSAGALPLRLFLHTEDTTRPTVQRVEAMHERLVRVKFNETVHPQPLSTERFVIRDSATAAPVPVRSITAPPDERHAWDLRLAASLQDAPYLLWADALADGVGNPIDTIPLPLVFMGTAITDTGRPLILATMPTANARGVEPDSSFRASFDRELLVENAFSLRDSSDQTLEITVALLSPTEIRIEHPPLAGEAIHTLCIDERALIDPVSGRSVGDSTRCFRFRTDKRDQYGTLSGTVEVADSGATAVVRLHDTGKSPRTRTAVADSVGAFRFEALQEGRYILDAFIDRNRNGRYDFGTARPIVRPEPYGRVRDTLRVRARWETNGIRIPLQVSVPPDSVSSR